VYRCALYGQLKETHVSYYKEGWKDVLHGVQRFPNVSFCSPPRTTDLDIIAHASRLQQNCSSCCKPASSDLTDLQTKPRVTRCGCLCNCLLRCDALWSGNNLPTFRSNYCTYFKGRRDGHIATSEKQATSIQSPYTLNMEEIFFSETPWFYRTIRRHIIEDCTLNMR
jgi:hypothetical protein